jgi:hypothetical protein
MTGAWLPLWIIGGPLLGILLLSSLYRGGTSASAALERRPLRRSRFAPVATPGYPPAGAYTSSDGNAPSSVPWPTGYRESVASERSPELESISRLSGPVNPGAISELSSPKSPGAVASLSGWKSPGAISRLSGRKSPGAISRLSGPKSPGAIAALSRPRTVGSIGSLSAGFYVSKLFGLPLLTRSQGPSEPDESLLIREHRRDG